MIVFLTTEYFVGDLIIPNLVDASASGDIITDLKRYIVKYEPEFLRYLLGTKLYDEFLDGMSAETPDIKWTTLKDQIFQKTEITVGPDTTEDYYLSPAANYVWFFHQRSKQTFATNVGEQSAKPQNSVMAISNNKLLSNWNAMAQMVVEFRTWIALHLDDYPDYQGDDTQNGVYVYPNYPQRAVDPLGFNTFF